MVCSFALIWRRIEHQK
uniref:Uncharacterized protein n=1 Tax=Arundo donax TaxID=35708 RepID=A0A0A9TXK7_ARUDO